MDEKSNPIECTEAIQQTTISLTCRLAERADKYARENGSTVTGVVIEALDKFLRAG